MYIQIETTIELFSLSLCNIILHLDELCVTLSSVRLSVFVTGGAVVVLLSCTVLPWHMR